MQLFRSHTSWNLSESLHLNNSMLKQHTSESSNTHWTISDEELLSRIRNAAILIENQFEGYREGVTLIKIDPANFFSPIIELKEGMQIYGEFKPRRVGEEPRRNSYVYSNKQIAKTVFACLYHKDVLAEDNDRESDCDWEVVTLLASPSIDKEPTPIPVGTLIANHLKFSGGTATNMSDHEFVE